MTDTARARSAAPKRATRTRRTPRSKATSTKSTAPGTEQDDGAVREHRVRQFLSAEAVDAIFRGYADYDPALWTRGFYMMAVARLYEALITGADDLPTGELLKLVKLLREGRIASSATRARENGAADTAPPKLARGEPLPPHLGDVVRQIYGVNLHAEDGEAEKTGGADK